MQKLALFFQISLGFLVRGQPRAVPGAKNWIFTLWFYPQLLTLHFELLIQHLYAALSATPIPIPCELSLVRSALYPKTPKIQSKSQSCSVQKLRWNS
jgi:hypothetical protein